MPQISVIVPVYNVEKYLHACLDSILAQTFTDFELILIDDGSPDTSGKICDEYAKKDSRIRVFHQENQGQAAARNFGVNQSAAEWIHFVDSDDIIHPQMLEILLSAAEGDCCNISMCDYIQGEAMPSAFLTPVSGKSCKIQITDEYLSSLVKEIDYKYHCIWAKLIRKDILLKFPFTAGRTREDSAVVCQWLYESETVSYVNEKLYFYLLNPIGTMHGSFSLKNFDAVWALEEQLNFCKRKNYQLLESALLCEYTMHLNRLIEKIENEFTDYKGYVKGLKKKFVTATRAAQKSPYVEKKDKLYFLELKHPWLMKLYWITVNKLK